MIQKANLAEKQQLQQESDKEQLKLHMEIEGLKVSKQAAVLDAKLAHQELHKATSAIQDQLDAAEAEKSRLASALKNAEANNITTLESL